MLEFAASVFVTFFVIIDPVGTVPIFLGLTAGMSAGERRRAAQRAIMVSASVLIVFAFAGRLLLSLLGISLPAFRIAGGVLLFLLSIDMVFARQSGIRSITEPETKEAGGGHDVAVFPLGVPLIAGPGAIASVLLLMNESAGLPGRQALVLALLLMMLLICLGCLLIGTRLVAWLGVTGINVVGRIAGIVLAALAVQFMLDGLDDILQA